MSATLRTAQPTEEPGLLELLDAARRRMKANGQIASRVKEYESLLSKKKIARYLPSLHGGDPDRGKNIFLNKTETSCRRCHQVGNLKPTDANVIAGPDLSDVGDRRDREYLLRSIVDPNAEITETFQDWMVETKEDDIYRGRVVEEDDKKVVMEVKEVGEPLARITIDKKIITFRKREKSPMPEDVITELSAKELRDLVAFLASQKLKK